MIFADISTYTVMCWIAAAITASLGLIVYVGGSSRSSRMFLLAVMCISVWTALVGAFFSAATPEIATQFVKLSYFAAASAATTFLAFFLMYPDDRSPNRTLLNVMWVLVPVYGYLYLFTNLIVGSAYRISSPLRFGWDYGPLGWLYFVIEYPPLMAGLLVVIRTMLRTASPPVRKNLLYMAISVVVLTIPPTVMNAIMPLFGNFSLVWLGPILSLGWISVIAYSIARYRALDVRTFTTEILNVALLIIFFANIFSSFSASTAARAAIFVVFLVITYYIIRLGSRVDDLNRNLTSKVKEQTKEIQGLYEVEKKARIELERLNQAKDQFIMVTQHHLRTPLTGIKWSLQALQEKYASDAELTTDLKESSDAVEQVNHLLDNFLSISELQVGMNVLKMERASLLPIVRDVLKDLVQQLKKMKITVTYPNDEHLWPTVMVDAGRMKEALFILIHNAVVYNQPQGMIGIAPKYDGKSFVVTIANTGIGIDPQYQKSIFTEKFSRSPEAMKAHPLGMGMGLTFAHYIVEAHKGTLAITSEGVGKGTLVTMTLPMR